MKNYLILFGLLMIISIVSAQETVSGVSKSGYVNITKDPPKPPYLEITGLRFLDTDGNMKIDATEQTFIYFNLGNSGIGPEVTDNCRL